MREQYPHGTNDPHAERTRASGQRVTFGEVLDPVMLPIAYGIAIVGLLVLIWHVGRRYSIAPKRVPMRVTGEPLQPNAEAAVSIRQHQIELLAKEPELKDNIVPAKVIRQVFLGSSRDYMVETGDGTQLRIVTEAEARLKAICGA